jgi:hypothetical protein
MEVHAHTHTERKKFKHYLWEFLMLFLAVFCGFLAENVREHSVEKQRERQFIRSLIADIQNDAKLIDQQNAFNKERIITADSLIDMLNDPAAVNLHSGEVYYLGRIAQRTLIFAYNDRTIEQMKNSGGFRLLRNEEAVNKIMEYYRLIKRIQLYEEREGAEQEEYKKIAIKIFDSRIFRKMTSDTIISRIPGNPPLLTNNPGILQELSGMVQYQTGSRLQIIAVKEDLKRKGLQLIELLKKEYHLQ